MHYQNIIVLSNRINTSDTATLLSTIIACHFFFFISSSHPSSFCTEVHTALRVILSLLCIYSPIRSIPFSLISWQHPTPPLIPRSYLIVWALYHSILHFVIIWLDIFPLLVFHYYQFFSALSYWIISCLIPFCPSIYASSLTGSRINIRWVSRAY